ncbi:hypothetical protein FA15DRAFT_546552, partial [Coprinopsis marcescibilis]
YSQSKYKLFGLFRVLKDVRLYIIGVQNLVVEIDALYVIGMINKPDIQPNATINRWIAGILLFTFTLHHVPARLHHAANSLSHCEPSPDDSEEDDNYEGWNDKANSFHVQVTNPHFRITALLRAKDATVKDVKTFLKTLNPPSHLEGRLLKRFICYSTKFFI